MFGNFRFFLFLEDGDEERGAHRAPVRERGAEIVDERQKDILEGSNTSSRIITSGNDDVLGKNTEKRDEGIVEATELRQAEDAQHRAAFEVVRRRQDRVRDAAFCMQAIAHYE